MKNTITVYKSRGAVAETSQCVDYTYILFLVCTCGSLKYTYILTEVTTSKFSMSAAHVSAHIHIRIRDW